MKPNHALKTAVLGYGRSGSSLHADPIEALDDFRMSAVCDLDPAARASAGKRFGCALYEDYHEMLRRETLDLVVIVTRSDQHASMVCDCLEAGHNVLITKPWAVNAAEARRMIQTAEASGKRLLPWLPARWGADFLRLKELIASGIIGRVVEIKRAEYSYAVRHDWQTEQRFGGGLLLNWGPHMIDPPVLLAGGKPVSVFGQLRQAINPGDVEDNFMSVITMDNGVTVVSEHKTVARGPYPNWIVQGTTGAILIHETEVEIHRMIPVPPAAGAAAGSAFTHEVVREEADGPNRITIGNRYGDAKVIYPEIAKAIRGQAPFPVTPASALRLTEILDAVRLSSRQGQVVRL